MVVLILEYSFQICVYYYFVFANKSNIQEPCCLKIFIGRVLTEVIKDTSFLKEKYLLSRVDNFISAPNIYCYNFNGRAVPWVSRWSSVYANLGFKVEFSA